MCSAVGEAKKGETETEGEGETKGEGEGVDVAILQSKLSDYRDIISRQEELLQVSVCGKHWLCLLAVGLSALMDLACPALLTSNHNTLSVTTHHSGLEHRIISNAALGSSLN